MTVGIRKEADLIINNHAICESAGWALVSVTEYIGVPQRHLHCIKLHVTLQRFEIKQMQDCGHYHDGHLASSYSLYWEHRRFPADKTIRPAKKSNAGLDRIVLVWDEWGMLTDVFFYRPPWKIKFSWKSWLLIKKPPGNISMPTSFDGVHKNIFCSFQQEYPQ